LLQVRRRAAVPLLLGLLLVVCSAGAADALLGKKPPEWQVTDWMNSSPKTLQELRGSVVLVRWWTAPDCPYCNATAPALNAFYDQYHSRGLEVIGLYHHKSDAPLNVDEVKSFSQKFGFKFPVAVDKDWTTLESWWLNHKPGAWTSVTFLIDRKGVVRHIHRGGQYVKGDRAYATMKARIEELLKEKAED
jgi:peroxiredoxin